MTLPLKTVEVWTKLPFLTNNQALTLLTRGYKLKLSLNAIEVKEVLTEHAKSIGMEASAVTVAADGTAEMEVKKLDVLVGQSLRYPKDVA
jgi:hypothetical protein